MCLLIQSEVISSYFPVMFLFVENTDIDSYSFVALCMLFMLEQLKFLEKYSKAHFIFVSFCYICPKMFPSFVVCKNTCLQIKNLKVLPTYYPKMIPKYNKFMY